VADAERVSAATEYTERLIRAADEAANRAVRGLVASIADGPLTAAINPDPASYESLPQEWERQVEAHLLPLTEAAYEAGTIQALVQLPHAAAEFLATNPDIPRVINPLVEEALVGARMEFAAIGPEATARVQTAIVEGVAAGDGVDAIGDRIVAAVKLSEARASVIARTESVRASNLGAHNQARFLAKYLPVTKEWLNTSDSRTRKTHVEAGGQEVGLDEAFEVGGALLQFPSDPAGPPQETVNCRCTTLYNEDGPPETAVEPIDLSSLRPPVAALVHSPDDFVAAGTPQVGETVPYHIVPNSADCDGKFAVVKDSDSEVMGCHETEDEAKDQMAALYAEDGDTDAAADVTAAEDPPNRWHGTLLVLNTPSDDGRQFNAVTWRELPQPLMREIKSTHGGVTSETVYVGNIDRIEVQGDEVLGWGDFDMADPEGAKSARWLAEGRFRHVSIDGGGVKDGDIEYVFPDGYDENGVSEDGESFAMPELTIYHNAIIMGATQVPFPAFGQAEIASDLQSGPPVTGEGESEAAALVAAGFPVDPPSEWFEDPQFDGPQAFTVDDSGRVAGHLALWGTCHTGIDKVCRTPPVESDYAYFETGEVVCADGSRVPCGQVTMGTGHAPSMLRQFAAAEHYDNTGTVVADIRCGRDAYGIWVAGAARPCVDGEQLRALRAATLSGDWRKFAGQLRLVAALAVNVPGFPVPRTSAATRSGEQITLVASGVVTPDALAQRTRKDYDRIAERIARSIGYDRPARVERLAARIGR
jgi:hypothetical protein